MRRILIIDDDEAVCASLVLLLKQAGFETRSSASPAAALSQLEGLTFDLVLQDMNFSSGTSGDEGLQLLAQIQQRRPGVPVLLMTAWGSIELAVKGVKAGAANFFSKPWDNVHLLEQIRTTLELTTTKAPGSTTRESLQGQLDLRFIVGEHPALLQVLATVGQVAKTRAPVLILGESGTGKELIADAIHRSSDRAQAPLLKINMGAITPTLFESEMFGHVKGSFTDARHDRKGHFASAQQGTLFMDEIGELQRPDQAKLLRVLQDQTYQPVGASRTERADVRIVSATNRELAELVSQGTFREDLFYRLNLITIRLPPLRERRSDIPLLAKAFVEQVGRTYQMGPVTLAPSALAWLTSQPWPGNVRQLKQTLERTMLLVGKAELNQSDFAVTLQDEPSQAQRSHGMEGMTLEQVERLMIEKALEQYQGNISKVAKALGLSRAAVYRRLERHGLSIPGIFPDGSSD